MKVKNFILILSLLALAGCKTGKTATSANLTDTREAYDSFNRVSLLTASGSQMGASRYHFLDIYSQRSLY